jgi:hypothetical protein
MNTEKMSFREAIEGGIYKLPVGFKDKDGNIHRTVEIGEMTGEIDEELAKNEVKNNGGKMITAAITHLLTQLGTIKNVKKEHARAMFNADREFILLLNYHNSIATDDHVCWNENCRMCKGNYEAQINYMELPVFYLEEGEPWTIDLELPAGIRKGGAVYKNITVTFPNGESQEAIAALLQKNIAEAITQMLALITVSIEGLGSYSFNTFKEMLKKDRTFIAKFINELEIGITMRVDMTCPLCNATYKSGIPVSALLGE